MTGNDWEGKGVVFLASHGVRKKKEAIFKEIVTLCPGNDYSRVVYLGPDAPFLSNVKWLFYRHIVKSDARKAYIPFQAVTIRQISHDLHETFGQNEIITDEIRTLLLLQLLEDSNLGYARLLSGLLNKIRHYIPDSDLNEIRSETGRLIFEDKARERALSAFDTLQAYEDLLSEKNYIDTEKLLQAAIQLIDKHFDADLLVIDGFHDPTPLEKAFISTLIGKSKNVLMLAEDRDSLTGAIENVRPYTVTTLRSSSERTGSGYYIYPSIEDEVEGIAKNIRDLLLQGTMPWEITLSFPDLSKYLPMVKRIFKRHGIPVSVGEYTLSGTKPLVAINEIITCIEDDFPRTDFLSVITSPWFPGIPVNVKEQAVNYAYRAGIIKGKESWLSIEKTIVNDTGRLSDEERTQIEEFQKGVSQIVELIESIKKEENLSLYTGTLLSVLERIGFFDGPISSNSDNTETIAGKITRQFVELQHFASTNDLPDKVHPGAYLRFVLESLSSSDIGTDGVRVVSYEQASSIETKYLFFGGMVEAEFPSKPPIDPIMPEKVKKALGMPYLEYYLKRQREYFNRLLNVAERPPFFSCPSAEGETIFLPSPFLNWNQSLRPIELDIFSEEEVLVREGEIRGDDTDMKVLWDGAPDLNTHSRNLMNEKLRGYLNVTDIDAYRKCPLRFYIERVLRLETDEPPRFEVEARLWGSLAHKVMEQLFKDGDLDIDNLDGRLFKCLEMSIKQFPIDEFWRKVAKEIFRKLLPKIKKQEHDLRMKGFGPVMVEKKLTADINGLKLKGKIDRIDIKKEGPRIQGAKGSRGNEKKNNSVILLDYKTGNIDSDSLQMALYVAMWRENSADPVEKAGYYSLKEGKITWFPKKNGMEEYINKKLAVTEELVGNMRRGYFPPEPYRDAVCRYCNHSPLCER
jgi:ATP-dependent helicase/DNAse subunit B